MSNYIPQQLYNKILKTVPILCIDVVVRCKEQVLLIKREDKPAQGEWWVVGGRLHIFESFTGAAKRILEGETGIKVSMKRIKHIGCAATTFPDSPAQSPMHSVNLVFYVEVKSKKVILDSHSSLYCWLDLKELKANKTLNPYLSYCLSTVN